MRTWGSEVIVVHLVVAGEGGRSLGDVPGSCRSMVVLRRHDEPLGLLVRGMTSRPPRLDNSRGEERGRDLVCELVEGRGLRFVQGTGWGRRLGGQQLRLGGLRRTVSPSSLAEKTVGRSFWAVGCRAREGG